MSRDALMFETSPLFAIILEEPGWSVRLMAQSSHGTLLEKNSERIDDRRPRVG
jgi:hypothetical protein